MVSIEMSGDKTGIIFSFRGKGQMPLFMITKEYFDRNGAIEFAEILFEIKGRKCKKEMRKIERGED